MAQDIDDGKSWYLRFPVKPLARAAACMLAMLPDQAIVRHHVGVAN